MIGEKIAILAFGSYKIKFLIISLDNNNYIQIHAKYSAFASGISKGNVTDIDKLSLIIQQCISSIEKELNIEIKEIYVGINSINFHLLNFCLSRDIGSYEIEEKKDLLSDIISSIFKKTNNYKLFNIIKNGSISLGHSWIIRL